MFKYLRRSSRSASAGYHSRLRGTRCIADPHSCTGGKWRYIILRQGDTVFFTSGTIHFVFRTRERQTFALGGHILQWSGIVEWAENVVAQIRSPNITNEALDDAPKIVRIAKRLVTNRMQTGKVAEMGGQNAVERFFDLVQVRTLSYLRRR